MRAEKIGDSKVWDAFLTRLDFQLFTQSAAWGSLRLSFGWELVRLGIYDGDELLGGMQVLSRQVAPGLKMAYAPLGPALDWSRSDVGEILKLMLTEFKEQSQGLFMLRLDPFVIEESTAATNALTALHKLGFIKGFEEIQARHSIYIDLGKGEEELLAAMTKRGRYSIRFAERKGVQVEEVSPKEGLPGFYKLYSDTARRLNFAARPKNYFEKLISTIAADGASFFEARYQNKLLSSSFITYFGKFATYMYGASSTEYREVMPSYIAQWESIKRAKRLGLKTYDMWGIVQTHDPSHHWAGYTHFKRQFGGREVSYIGTYDLPLSKPKYLLFKNGQALRKKLLGLKAE